MHKVFVYGTLKQGFHNNQVINRKGSQKLCDASITGGYRMYSLGAFPAVVTCEEPEATIIGELWECTGETLQHVNHLEGYHERGDNNFYERIKVTTDCGQEALMYCMAGDSAHIDGAPLVSSGEWT